MSVLIKGMEIPKNCFDCPLFDDVYTDADGDDDYRCGLGVPLDYYQASGKTKKDCPLVHVPEHGDLIDRDALIKDGWLNLHKEVIRMGGYAIHELPLKNPSIPVIIPAEPPKEGE